MEGGQVRATRGLWKLCVHSAYHRLDLCQVVLLEELHFYSKSDKARGFTVLTSRPVLF